MGEPYDPQQVREFIRRERPHIVAFVQAETSTGMFNHAKPICEAAHEVDALVIADCVTSLGGMPCWWTKTGSTSPTVARRRAWVHARPGADNGGAARARTPQGAHLPGAVVVSGLLLLDTYYSGHKYHHTASATLFYALREALAMVAEEGLENRWERHRRNHLAFVAGIEAMGLTMHIRNSSDRLWTLNTPRVPEGVDDAQVRKFLLEERGIEIAGGSGRWRAKSSASG